MKKRILLLAFFCSFAFVSANAQFTKYIVKFKHKGDNPFSISNPSQYLSARSLARRTRYNIAIDSTDLPITPRFVDSVRLAGAVTILNQSKWLNQIAIQTSDAAALAKINSLPFVISSAPLAPFANTSYQPVNKKLDYSISTSLPNTSNGIEGINDVYNYGASSAQVKIHNGQFLHNRGYSGQGMQMAIMDAGFINYLSLGTFDSVRMGNQILGTWDYVTNTQNVNGYHGHGTACFSTIAANMPGVFMGTAPKTSFYLYRTEDAATEYPIEEQNWAAAAEKADSLGVDVFSVSLGYFIFDNPIFNYTYASMDGNTTLSARAADFAAKKGILACIAAGNEGASSWRKIITPSDADSVVAVGAVNTAGVIANFSSRGPSSDGQIKPNVTAVGAGATIVNINTGQPGTGSGTSFATPNMAGIVTCLWQAFPEENNMSIINAIQQAGSKAANPDTAYGYGTPNMLYAFSYLIKQRYTQSININSCKANIQFGLKTDTGIVVFVERKLSNETNYSVLNSQNTTGNFLRRNFSYVDDLATAPSGTIKYRIRIKISADTSFYLDSTTVNFIAKPNLGADKSTNVCPGNTIDLTTQFITTGLNNNWTFGGNTVANPTSVSVAGVYQLVSSNASGCSDTALFALNNFTKPNLGADKTVFVCRDSAYNLNSIFTTTGLTTSWTLNGTVVATPNAVTQLGTYQLIVTNTDGCKDTALAILANFNPPCTVQEKIVISPNPVSDKLNILIARNNAVKVDVIIYNSAGQKIFTLTQPQSAGMLNYTIPFTKFGAGVYYVTVFIDNAKAATKRILKR